MQSLTGFEQTIQDDSPSSPTAAAIPPQEPVTGLLATIAPMAIPTTASKNTASAAKKVGTMDLLSLVESVSTAAETIDSAVTVALRAASWSCLQEPKTHLPSNKQESLQLSMRQRFKGWLTVERLWLA